MKKLLTVLFAFLFTFLISCDKDDNFELVRMRINHYQKPVNNAELFSGLSYIVQTDNEIGTDVWHGFSNNISGFDYELGYVYDIEVQEKHIENPYIDAPGSEYILHKIVSMKKVPQETTFDITLAIKYSNGFESLVTKDNSMSFS